MDCRKKIDRPRINDCINCEYQELCKMESIVKSADEISDIRTENTKGVMDRVSDFNERGERKLGPMWGCLRVIIFYITLATICILLGETCS